MSDDVTVSELAAELNIPPSVLLEECHRSGVEASWAGARLSPVAASMLRDRLGVGAEPPLRREPRPPRSTASPKLPPTAVGSLPEAAGGVQDPHGPGPLPRNDQVQGEATEVSERTLVEPTRRFDVTARRAIVAAGIGLVLVVATPSSPHVLVTIAGWLLLGVAAGVAFISGNRSRYKISTHPEKFRGMVPAIVAMVVGLGLLIGLGVGIWTVLRSAPASAAPDLVGSRADVAELRWTYHRVARIKDAGWHRPVKDAGTCWVLPEDDDEEPRDELRVETSYRDRSCEGAHDVEVLAVFAVDRNADSPYPGIDDLKAFGLGRCSPVVDALAELPRSTRIEIEYPTEDGWKRADHDVACVAVVTRNGSLAD